jgi:branched-chain amino acid transport system permease protein
MTSHIGVQSVSARGVEVGYLSRGQGPRKVVLVHGLFCTPHYWEGLMGALPPEEFSSFAVDLFVHSERPWGGWNVSGFADEVRDFVDALGLGKVILGGHSMGGVVAQIFALRYPERVEKLLLVGTGATVQGHGTYVQFCDLVRRGVDRETTATIVSAFFASRPPEGEFSSLVEYALKGKPEALSEALDSLANYNLTGLLGYIHQPALIVHGTLDSGRQREHAEGLKKGIPHSRLVLMEAGHAMMMERPEEFNRSVLDFLHT